MPSTDSTVRVMRPDEWDLVQALAVHAFGGDEHIGQLLDMLHASWAWDDELSFVAEHDGRVVGHVLFTHGFVDAPRQLVDVLILSPLGVLPAEQQRGVGSILVRAALTEIADRVPAVFLEGNPSYYRRFGFERADTLGFKPPSPRIPPPAFQVRTFEMFEPWMTGRLVYPDAFWRADAVGLRP